MSGSACARKSCRPACFLQVHDELIVEAPEAECDEVKRILKEEMENVVHYSVPLTTEVGTGKTWVAAH